MRARGATKQAIVNALTKNGPMTAAEIAEHAGLPGQVVRVSIGAMITRFGGAVRVGKVGTSIIYGIPGRDNVSVRKSLRENVAGPRYVPDMSGVLRRDPFEHQKLAMAGR
jgi:hypothetical protein